MTDEDVIRRRLLIDGDGTGDDRRLNVLLKSLIKWCNTDYENPEESRAMHDRMLAQLGQCEFAVTKSQLSSQMIFAEMKKYEELSLNIEKRIEEAKSHIQASKAELKQAKIVRKNRIEYDVLAKVINEQPDRKNTLERLVAMRKELDSLEKTKQQLEYQLKLRRKQFHVLVKSVHHLQELIDNESDIGTNAVDDIEMTDK